jgi:hypothetical protein
LIRKEFPYFEKTVLTTSASGVGKNIEQKTKEKAVGSGVRKSIVFVQLYWILDGRIPG